MIRLFLNGLAASAGGGLTYLRNVVPHLSARSDVQTTVALSEAFARELRQWTGRGVLTIHHGFDRDKFFQDTTSLPSDVWNKLDAAQGSLRLLFVSHYNYYRNFETLLRAIPLLKARLG